jgi:phage-related protein
VAKSVDLVVKIITDTAQATKGLDQTEKTMGRVGKAALGVAGAVAGAMIVDKVVAFGKSAMQAASDTQQAMGAVDSVFGKSADQIKAWSDTSATAVGLSKSQYGQMASVIGAQLKNLGVPFDKVAQQTNDLIKMGADLAATYGGTTAQAVEALSAALRGETDPIERYGISIKQATIEAKVGKDKLKAMTIQQQKAAKTAALLALTTEQAGGAIGQFARESDTAAGSQQIATAQWQDAKSAIGTALLPVVSKLAVVMGGLAGILKEHSTLVLILVGAVGAFAVAMTVLSAATTVYTAVVTIAGQAAAKAWLAALGPIGLVIAAVLAVVAVIIFLWNKFPPFRNAVIAVWNSIRAAASAVAAWVQSVWAAIWPPLSVAVRVFGTLFKVQFALIQAVVRLAAALIGAVFRVAFGVVRAVASPVIALIAAGFRALAPVINSIANALRGPLASAFRWVGSAASAAGRVLSGAFSGFLSFINTITGAVNSLISALNRIKVPKISLPKIPGLSAAAASPAAAAVSPTGVGARLAAAPVGTRAVGGPTIIIQGAVDPEATARQIRRLIGNHDRRVGLTGTALRTGAV